MWSETEVKYYTVSAPYRVGQVRVTMNEHGKSVEYMCVETGVGSGSVYREDQLFYSLDQADVYAETQNWVTKKEAFTPVGVL